jgi:hypothetical protein
VPVYTITLFNRVVSLFLVSTFIFQCKIWDKICLFCKLDPTQHLFEGPSETPESSENHVKISPSFAIVKPWPINTFDNFG